MTQQSSHTSTIHTYITGFLLSLILTLVAYAFVQAHHGQHIALSNHFVIFTIAGLAIVQLVVQLYFFLHLGRDKRPHWNVSVFAFALGVIGIIVGGSIWIMTNLDYNMSHKMNESQMNEYLHSQDSL